MAYINQEILEKHISREELIRLTDDDNSGGVNYANIEEAINSASQEFENYLRDTYDKSQFPAPLPEVLTHIISDIAIYNLYKRRFRLEMPDSITEIYRMAIDKLNKIARGEIQIDIPKKSTAGFIKINKVDSDKIFNKDTLDSF
jgi:phage gp36-like protein